MNWRRRKTTVYELSSQASAQCAARRRIRGELSKWSRDTFGGAEGLALSFAAGAWVGYAKSSDHKKASVARRTILGAANALWFARRLKRKGTSNAPSQDDVP